MNILYVFSRIFRFFGSEEVYEHTEAVSYANSEGVIAVHACHHSLYFNLSFLPYHHHHANPLFYTLVEGVCRSPSLLYPTRMSNPPSQNSTTRRTTANAAPPRARRVTTRTRSGVHHEIRAPERAALGPTCVERRVAASSRVRSCCGAFSG